MKRNQFLMLGLLPAIFLMTFLFVLPSLWGIYSSFTNMALLGRDAANFRFLGLENYIKLFKDSAFYTSFVNTIYFVVGSALIGQFLLGLIIALLIDYAEKKKFPGRGIVYGIVLLAWINPTLIAGFQWGAMYDYYYGTLNTFLKILGVPKINWLGTMPMLSVIVANIWRGTAFTMLIWLSALKTVPIELYEASKIDGANAFNRFRYITVPMLRDIITVNLIQITMATMGAFLLIWAITSGGPGLKTTTLSLFAYRTAFESYRLGYGSAIAVIMLFINLVFGIIYIRLFRRR